MVSVPASCALSTLTLLTILPSTLASLTLRLLDWKVFPLSKRYKNNAIEVAMLNYISTVDQIFGLSDPRGKVTQESEVNND